MGEALSVVVWSKQGCHYCEEVKQYLKEKEIAYQTVDVTNHDERRDILEIKYGVRYVPIIEIGRGNVYESVTEIGIPYLEKVLERIQ
ncbi:MULTISPECIES: glutaredoxin [Peribacillus]|uniref:glutaredoxin family protein n=1 Tax=Peribacillus TaxID=2675229 RepID=UPI00203E0A84|nr:MULTISPECIES: glutaredoxin [Peribacillus]MCM3675809.1 glutaredoxin [Peribacillus simplex]MDQ0880619.1 glutaredoxin 3 [Peribacillus sp. V2I11]